MAAAPSQWYRATAAVRFSCRALELSSPRRLPVLVLQAACTVTRTRMWSRNEEHRLHQGWLCRAPGRCPVLAGVLLRRARRACSNCELLGPFVAPARANYERSACSGGQQRLIRESDSQQNSLLGQEEQAPRFWAMLLHHCCVRGMCAWHVDWLHACICEGETLTVPGICAEREGWHDGVDAAGCGQSAMRFQITAAVSTADEQAQAQGRRRRNAKQGHAEATAEERRSASCTGRHRQAGRGRGARQQAGGGKGQAPSATGKARGREGWRDRK